MSPSPDLCIRLITMLQNRPRNASRTPGEGAIGTLAPAIAATFPDHGPAALTTRSAWSSPVFPVTWSRTAAPETTPSCTSSPVTSMYGRMSAPL